MSNVRPQPVTDYGYLQQLWTDLMAFIGNPYGVAGLMGNLYAESKCVPYVKEGNVRPPWTPSETYTNNVDSGATSRNTFCNDGVGYGLAQWTYYTRKERLYDFAPVSSSSSIGSYSRGLGYLKWELLNNFLGVYTVLVNATSLKEASDKVLHDFENPAVQTPAVEDYREGLSLTIYNDYSGAIYHTVTVTVDGNGFAYAQPTTAVIGTPINLYQNAFDQDIFTGWTVLQGGVIIDANDSFLMPDWDVAIEAHFTGSTPPPPTPTHMDAKTLAIISNKWRYFIPNLQ